MWKVKIRGHDYNGYLDVLIYREDGQKFEVVEPIQINIVEKDKKGGLPPTFRIGMYDFHLLQKFVDELYNSGIKLRQIRQVKEIEK